MTTFFFGFCLSGFVFPEFQQIPSYKTLTKKQITVHGFYNFNQVSSELPPGSFKTKGGFLTKLLSSKCVTFIPCHFVFQLSTFHIALFRTRALILCQLLEDNIVPVLSASLAYLFHTDVNRFCPYWTLSSRLNGNLCDTISWYNPDTFCMEVKPNI